MTFLLPDIVPGVFPTGSPTRADYDSVVADRANGHCIMLGGEDLDRVSRATMLVNQDGTEVKTLEQGIFDLGPLIREGGYSFYVCCEGDLPFEMIE